MAGAPAGSTGEAPPARGIPRPASWLNRTLAALANLPLAVQLEIAAVVAIALLGFVLRTIDLASLPNGMHGDEAVAGLQAQHILDHGGIGVYSRPAAGQPAGPLYLFAIPVWLLGHTLLAVRLVPAILGALTVPLLYAVVRRSLGREIGIAAAFFLAVMGWHIHFARIGFPLESWPFFTLLAVGALMEAVRSGSWRWWAIAGALTAAGVYVYNAEPLMLAAIGIFLAGLVVVRGRGQLVENARALATFAGAALIVAIPMVSYVADESNHYFDHINRDKITATAEWKALDGPFDQAHFVAGRYVDFWDRLTFHPELDGVDATGITPVVPLAMLLLGAAGVVLALWKRRTPLVALGVVTVLLMPLGSALTVDGTMRRTFMIAPFLAMFCGIGAVELVKLARALAPRLGRDEATAVSVAGGLMAGLSLFIGGQNVYNYFWSFRDSPAQEWVFVTDFTESVNYIHAHDEGRYVYYLSNRWSFNYEPRQFVAPEAQGEDRSLEFGRRVDLGVDLSKGRPLFILEGTYREYLPALQQLYPGGTVDYEGDSAGPDFIAYSPPG